jgi:hypothetical protein
VSPAWPISLEVRRSVRRRRRRRRRSPCRSPRCLCARRRRASPSVRARPSQRDVGVLECGRTQRTWAREFGRAAQRGARGCDGSPICGRRQYSATVMCSRPIGRAIRRASVTQPDARSGRPAASLSR